MREGQADAGLAFNLEDTRLREGREMSGKDRHENRCKKTNFPEKIILKSPRPAKEGVTNLCKRGQGSEGISMYLQSAKF